MKDLNVRPETIKLLEENTGNNFLDMGQRNIFSRDVSSGEKNKSKIKLLGLHLHSEGNHRHSNKASSAEREKTFANDKELIPQIYKELL